MIAFLRGELVALAGDEVWIDVGGVGFRVAVSRQTQRRLPPAGEPVRLLTRLVVREDQWSLYGFATADEQAAFDALLTVSGVGPRVALAVLSVLSPEELRRAVVLQDPALLTRVPGVGPKLARRLLTELRDRLGEPLAEGAAAGAVAPAGGAASTPGGLPGGVATSPREDALAALESLGYSRAEAEGALAAAAGEVEPDAPAAAWVRAALRALGGARAAGGAGR
ncbi:Holliday junction DNA helicase RuvA [Thermaerobacter marianensis DSM 12885]|uniref:Holliday junction branch migration complex subunit RuvA n=1 Tax=Thermaerobacter marianensis (strain ATCC 700841 / DSM 12885 / JCM 10246 / 7p75a) TaxID=644966 RepID=E6SIW7_THEM7|nr:Holliday junction branch migration protein RuvA [Thermaerobacter marianensis]ADU50962.1 Holliday junction DNA helicase RuvA [Thermaerobacter marianensis DSM 12885]